MLTRVKAITCCHHRQHTVDCTSCASNGYMQALIIKSRFDQLNLMINWDKISETTIYLPKSRVTASGKKCEEIEKRVCVRAHTFTHNINIANTMFSYSVHILIEERMLK